LATWLYNVNGAFILPGSLAGMAGLSQWLRAGGARFVGHDRELGLGCQLRQRSGNLDIATRYLMLVTKRGSHSRMSKMVHGFDQIADAGNLSACEVAQVVDSNMLQANVFEDRCQSIAEGR
jgi:hypothetical protein